MPRTEGRGGIKRRPQQRRKTCWRWSLGGFAFRRDGPTHSHTHTHTTPLNNGWSEAPAGPPGDIICCVTCAAQASVWGEGRSLVVVGEGSAVFRDRERERGNKREKPTCVRDWRTNCWNDGSSVEEALWPRPPAARQLQTQQHKWVILPRI